MLGRKIQPIHEYHRKLSYIGGILEMANGVSRGANLAIAAKFPWAKYRTFVDVGTAQSDLAAQVALAHPHL